MRILLFVLISFFSHNVFAEVADTEPYGYESPTDRSLFVLNLNLSCKVQKCLKSKKVTWTAKQSFALYTYVWSQSDSEAAAKKEFREALNTCFDIKIRNIDNAGYSSANTGRSPYKGPEKNCK